MQWDRIVISGIAVAAAGVGVLVYPGSKTAAGLAFLGVLITLALAALVPVPTLRLPSGLGLIACLVSVVLLVILGLTTIDVGARFFEQL